MHPSKQPTVLQVLPALGTGGVERGTVEMTRALVRAGFRAIVVSSGGPLAASVAHAGGEHITLPLNSKNFFRMLLNVSALEKIIRQHRVTIVHARSRAPAWSAYYAACRTGAHFITTFHGIYGLENEMKRRYNAIMTRGERVIAISQFVARHVEKEYGTPRERIRVIPRGADARQFSPGRVPAQRLADLSISWNLPEHLPVILFPARITRWKGQDVFVEALARMKHKRFIALLVGSEDSDTFRQELEDRILALNLGGRIRFVGSTQQMAEAYTLARVVVATSTEPEAFGRVAVEAQAMGRPVIASNHGGSRETVAHEHSGWLLPPGDVDALAATLDRALEMPEEEYRKMSEAAIANAANFTTEMMCDRTIAVYQEVLETSAQRRRALAHHKASTTPRPAPAHPRRIHG